jgi:uncharacterized protein (TIGR02246 family)
MSLKTGVGRATAILAAGLLGTLSVAACRGTGGRSAEPAEPPGLRAGVDSAADRLLAALRANNADSLMGLLASDVVLMPPGEPRLVGKAEVRAWYDRFLTQLRTSELTIGDREVLIGGEWATEIATFVWVLAPVGGGPAVTDRGSYLQVWHHEPDGRWRFAREIWNSAAPPAGASPRP